MSAVDVPTDGADGSPASDLATTVPTGDGTGWDATRVATAVVTFLPALALAAGGWAHRWVNEDAFINFRIVEQVVAGHGPVFNVGERVEAYTSPLWLGVLVGVRLTVGQVLSMQWASVVVGLALAVAGFALGGRVARRVHPDGIPVPLGLIAVAAVPVVWDFATSGLELSAVYLWLAGCWGVLVATARATEPATGRRRALALLLLGLGPVLRPDLAVMSATMLLTWAWLARPPWRRLLLDAVVAAGPAVAYQVFRMGYFGALVPSTALAKDAGGVYLGQGVDYALDLDRPYLLWVPLVVLGAVLVHGARRRGPRLGVATVGMAVGGVVHGAYMVVIGGDYMHGRLLIPALLGIALPASVALPRRAAAGASTDAAPTADRADRAGAVARAGGWAPVVAVAVVGVWAVACAGFLRYEQPEAFGLPLVSDWRQSAPRPLVEPEEERYDWLTGADVAVLYDDGARGTIMLLGTQVDPTGDPSRLVWALGSIGLAGYDAGVDVHIVDIGGLAEPLAARSDPIPGRAAGHRKEVDPEWYTARWGIVARDSDPALVEAAERALACPDMRDLVASITAPMTPGRFWSNLVASPRLTALRVPADPRDAPAC